MTCESFLRRKKKKKDTLDAADWALGTAVAAVYGFGFALMTPQLWMNYRLKSVAHLPWNSSRPSPSIVPPSPVKYAGTSASPPPRRRPRKPPDCSPS